MSIPGRLVRRAVLRGTAAAALSALLAWLGRRRSVPVAAATGFAVGAAQELPLAGAVAAPVALVAATRRPISDVGTGTAIGTAVALATRRAWPVPPRHAAAVRTVFDARAATPSPDGNGVTIVVNPNAGSGRAAEPADVLREALPEAEIVALGEGDDLAEALERAAGASVLGVCGGDGSVNAAAAVAVRRGVPLLVVPGGTLNHFARDIGIETIECAVDAVRDGRLAEVDLGCIAMLPFLNTASFGAYAELVDARERLESRLGKWAALAVAMGRVLRRVTPCHVRFDGCERRIWMIFIGNCRYHPSGFAPAWRERLDDGWLDVRLVDAATPWSRTRLVFAILSGRLGRCRVYEEQMLRCVDVQSLQGSMRLAHDGETFDGPEEFTLQKASARLTVCLPRG